MRALTLPSWLRSLLSVEPAAQLSSLAPASIGDAGIQWTITEEQVREVQEWWRAALAGATVMTPDEVRVAEDLAPRAATNPQSPVRSLRGLLSAEGPAPSQLLRRLRIQRNSAAKRLASRPGRDATQ